MHWIAFFLAMAASLSAQTAVLRVRVTDESGAVIPGALVAISGPSGKRTAAASVDGSYSFSALAPGSYIVDASAPDMRMAQPITLAVRPGVQTLDLRLRVAAAGQQVTVRSNAGPEVSAEAANNASATVLTGHDLEALADNPEDLEADLLALAGPSAGPNGGSIFVDGFSGGQLPPKESIREIRINQNPFSPEYDKLGYGRIEIFTKPGADKFKGTVFYNFGHDAWNTRNPYAAQKAPFFLQEYGGNLSGPIRRGASFVLDVQHHPINNGAVINGTTVDPVTLEVINPYTSTFEVKQRRWIVTPRVDYQLSSNHTLVARYNFTHTDIDGLGVGGFNLPERGTRLLNDTQTAQLTETAVLGAHAVNETRFQYFRIDTTNRALSDGYATEVLGAFGAGGSPTGQAASAENSYEFQNYTSLARGRHTWRFGVRVRGAALDDTSPQNFNGTVTFGGGEGITSIERYRRTLLYLREGLPPAEIRALDGGATQWTYSSGNPEISGSQWDAGVFAGDDWRVRPNLTLSLGLRWEAQTNLRGSGDAAPRIGIAWAPGGSGAGKPKTVARAGFGIFYDRFALNSTLAAERFNGVVIRQFVVENPDYPPAVTASPAPRLTQTIQQKSASLRAPYIVQSAAAIERQLPFNSTVAVTYANSHGLHMLRSRVLDGPVFQMESSGLYNQNQLLVNVNTRVNKDVSLFGSYVFNRARGNTDGLGTFPANPRSDSGEYGPAATDIHNRVTGGGSLNTLWGVRLSPLFVAESGPPFDITVGRDIYGTTLFNGRPGIATDPSRPGLVPTPYGLLDPSPIPGEALVPRNYGRGPGSVSLNLRIARTFAFGRRGEGNAGAAGLPGGLGPRPNTTSTFGLGTAAQNVAATAPRRFNLVISMSIRNLLNHNNPGDIIGNITSPLFGQANQPAGSRSAGGTGLSESANNRRLELQTRLTF